MTGSDVAEQHRRYTTYHPKCLVRVVVHGDAFTVADTKPDLSKIRSQMCEWYDVKVRGILDRGKRDVRDIEILGRSLRWKEEGLKTEACDNIVMRCWKGWD